MNVPNHEKKAFRDMTPEERSAIVEAILTDNAEAYGVAEWQTPSPWVAFDGVYRTRPRQLVIPWEHIKPEYKWAELQGSIVWLYKQNPKTCHVDDIDAVPLFGLDIDVNGIVPSESLTARPEGV